MRPEGYSARQAAKVCGIGRATVQRALKDGRLQGKKKNGVWVIAPRALEAAGFLPRQTFEQARIASLEANVRSLKEQLAAIENQLAEEEARAERWVSADEARRLLSLFSDPWGKAELDKYEDVTRTLVALRPEPDSESDTYFTWATPVPAGSNTPDDQFSVSLDRDGDILLNDDYEQVAHLLDFGQAELLGRRLLAASDRAHRLIEEES